MAFNLLRHRGTALAALVVLSACSGASDPPAIGDYTLIWYPRTGTDYGRVIPGFETLSMCRYAGASRTMERLAEKYGSRADYSDVESPPWFECGTECRVEDGQKFIVCEQIEESRGVDARSPAAL